MEDVLLEPVELNEAELEEVAGGGGCSNSCNPCNPCEGGPNIAVALAVAVAGSLSVSL